MKFDVRRPAWVFALVLAWRIALLAFTAQPIPNNDAFFFDGPVVNWVLHGHYFNPVLSEVFPISGHQVYATYPPLYQAALTVWMLVFGASVISAMAFHLGLFAVAGLLVLAIVRRFFPATTNYALVPLFFLAITFTDRPEDLAHVFGLAMLWLLGQTISGRPGWLTISALTLALWLALYTSVIVGAFYFGTGFLVAALAWLSQRKNRVFLPFITAAVLFAAITGLIARTEPLLWRGFLENARQTPMLVNGFHSPKLPDVLKLVRSAPVFLIALFLLPATLARWRKLLDDKTGDQAGSAWLFLTGGVFLMGWGLLALDMVLLSPNYVFYLYYAQALLAAGLLALAGKIFSTEKMSCPCWFRGALMACIILVSLRAIGMTTWGVACAWKNSYARTHETLRTELSPYAASDAPVLVSSAFGYSALEFNVRHPIHSDWYYDRATAVAGSDYQALLKLRPPKLVLTQFDYYRAFAGLVKQLQEHPDVVTVRVRDLALVRTPDSIPSMQRVLQHISWAPVIVDLDWKQ